MDGFGRVLWAGRTWGQILPTVGVLARHRLPAMGVAIWRVSTTGKIFQVISLAGRPRPSGTG